MEIFPHVLVRIGGGPFGYLEQMQFDQLLAKSQQLIEERAEKERKKIQLSEHLLDHIRMLSEAKAQNDVQNVRRDLFNNRPIKPAALETAKRHLKQPLQKELDDYICFLQQMQEGSRQLEQVYEQETQHARKQLQELTHDENLRKGLVLSSQTLLDSLHDYQQKEPHAFRKREFQTEYSLLKYLTRMCTKTSPFSTFNHLALGALAEGMEKPIQWNHAAGDRLVGKSHIRLNNQLFKYLKDLFTASPQIYRKLSLRPNPTLSRQEDHFLYLTNHNNIEAFQRMPAHPVVLLLLPILSLPVAGIRFDTLVQEVLTYMDASAEELEKYVKQLVDYGLLEFDLGVSGNDPDWDVKLVALLQPLAQEEVPHIATLIHCLQHMRVLAGQYASADVTTRKRMLLEAYELLSAVCMQLHEAANLPEQERQSREELLAGQQAKQKERVRQQKEKASAEVVVAAPESDERREGAQKQGTAEVFRHQSSTFFYFKPEQLFYEDATSEVSPCLDADAVRTWVNKLHHLLGEMQLFQSQADEKEQMAHFFRQKYGEATSVDLLTFYEAYYREVKKPEAERENQHQKAVQQGGKGASPVKAISVQGQLTGNVAEVPASVRRKQAIRKWQEKAQTTLAANLCPTDYQVRVTLENLKTLNGLLNQGSASSFAHSHGAFVQFYQEAGEQHPYQLKGVLNASFPGYGKMMSRFLHLFPESVTQTVRDWNRQQMDEQSLFVEDCDASYFNANLHPPLMPFEIRVPGGHNTLPPEQQLPITDFEVCFDENKQELQLRHSSSQKNAYLFDLGFQGQNGRSQLFLLLEKFTRAEHLFVQPIIQAINTGITKAKAVDGKIPVKDVQVFPRIVYEEQIVLQRKTWHLPKASLPARKPNETDAEYFLAVTDWRKQLGLVDEVFVCIHPNRYPNTDPALFQKLGRDDYKPQYIHFGNPLLIHVFERLIAKVPVMMKIEEMLPTSTQLAQIGQHKFVTEQMVQWYT